MPNFNDVYSPPFIASSCCYIKIQLFIVWIIDYFLQSSSSHIDQSKIFKCICCRACAQGIPLSLVQWKAHEGYITYTFVCIVILFSIHLLLFQWQVFSKDTSIPTLEKKFHDLRPRCQNKKIMIRMNNFEKTFFRVTKNTKNTRY